jgi:predicted lipid-binding transport protein (Tim44 family)
MPDTQTLGLCIAAAVAGVVCLRLYWVLGRRTGLEPQPVPGPAPLPAPVAVVPASGNGLLDIQHADPGFDTAKFLEGARAAYSQIVEAFVRGDVAALQPLLSADVLAAFEAGIRARSAAPAALTRLNDARIVGAQLEGRSAEITVAFAADFSGEAVTDVWSFTRNLDAADPNWVLVATSGDLPE